MAGPTILARDANNAVIQVGRLDVDQTVTIGATSAQSAAFGAGVRLIMILATVDSHIKFGANPTAAATNFPVKANTYLSFAVNEAEKVAVIQNSTGGTLYIAEMGPVSKP